MKKRLAIITLLLIICLAAAGAAYADGSLCPGCMGYAPGNHGIGVSHTGSRIFVGFSLDDALLEVEASNLNVIDSVDVSSAGLMLSSTTALFSPDDSQLWLANYGTGNIIVVNTQTNTVSTVLSIAPNWGQCLSFTTDGSKALVADVDGVLYMVDTTDFSYESITSAGVYVYSAVQSTTDSDVFICLGRLPNGEDMDHAIFTYNKSSSLVVNYAFLSEESAPSDVGLSKLAVNQDQTRAYWGYCQQANDQGEGYMTAFDLSSFAVLNSTAMTYGVQDFVYQESTGKIYVAGFWTGGSNPGYLPVLEWDVSSYEITDQLSVSGSSDQAALALNPADADILYLTDGDANTLYQLSIASGEVTNQVAFNEAAMEPMTIIAGDGIGYVVSLYSNQVVKVDLATARFKGSFTLPEGISGMIAGGYNDGKLYFCQDGSVYEVNAQTGSLIRTISTGTDAASGNFTFYGDNAVMLDLYPGGMTGRRLLYFSADDMSLIDTVALSEELYGDRVMASPDGTKLYYTRGPSIGGDAYIDIVNASTREVADTITIASVDVYTRGCTSFVDAYFDTANRRAYILGWGSVYVVDMDSNELLDVLDTNDVRNSDGEEYSWAATALSGVTVNTDGDVLMISAGDSHCVYFYDLTNTAWLTDVVNLNGYFPSDATACGSYFYTVNRLTDSLSVVDRSTLSLDKTMDLANPDQTDLTPPLLLLMDNCATAD